MASIHQFQQRAKNIKPSKVKIDLFRYIRTLEQLFFQLNLEQLNDRKNAKGGVLKNSFRRYSGVYSEATEEIAKSSNALASKKAGEPYNFLWTGDFFKGFELFIRNGDLELFSTGTGNGDKANFFDGYKDLFGLTDENLNQIINEKLYPFTIQFFRTQLGL